MKMNVASETIELAILMAALLLTILLSCGAGRC
jgi:hypothetical protein